jgi:hypothetical protein
VINSTARGLIGPANTYIVLGQIRVDTSSPYASRALAALCVLTASDATMSKDNVVYCGSAVELVQRHNPSDIELTVALLLVRATTGMTLNVRFQILVAFDVSVLI